MVSIEGTYQYESQENIEEIWEAMGKYFSDSPDKFLFPIF